MNKKVYIAMVLVFVLGFILFLLSTNPLSLFITWDSFEIPSPDSPDQFSVLNVNVGNADLRCAPYKYKLCFTQTETKIQKNIARLHPNIVFLQEALALWQCEQTHETNPGKVCSEKQSVPQIRRLLGDDYTIVCNSINQTDCIAVQVNTGNISGCPTGDVCVTPENRTSRPIEGCDPGFTVMAATVELQNGNVFDVVNTHLPSASDNCREKLLSQVFQNPNSKLIENKKILVAGDFNMDIWRSKANSVKKFNQIYEQGWMGKPFRFHSGSAENIPPYITYTFFLKRTLDLVYSNFAEGTMVVLGVSPGTPSMDEGFGMDHEAIFGWLSFSSEDE